KAAARARHLGYWAQRLSVAVQTREKGTWWSSVLFEGGSQDTLAFGEALRRMWAARPRGAPKWVDVTLHDLIGAASYTPSLFEPERQREDLARIVDRLDARFGPHTVYPASMHNARGSARGGIAFSSIPDLSLADSVG